MRLEHRCQLEACARVQLAPVYPRDGASALRQPNARMGPTVMTSPAPTAAALLLSSAATAPRRPLNLKSPRAGTHGVRLRNRPPRQCRAAVVEKAGAQEDGVLLPKEAEEAAAAGRYDWREEWYPLYLSKEVPDDAALPLTVFDRQLVLYRDADGVLRCHEDRCPHRCCLSRARFA